MDQDEKTGKAAGGHARAEALSPERKKEIASEAAKERWRTDLPRATHEGILKIGNAELPCYVLEDGKRILSTRGIMRALGRRWRGRKYSGTSLPVFLEANNLKPFIDSDLAAVLAPLDIRTPGGLKMEGFSAEILPMVCNVYLRARDEEKLAPGQEALARQCDILIRALSTVGIVALVDEATGYQDVRDRQALQAILDAVLRKELAAWAKRFPDEFYEHIFRLRGWQWRGRRSNPPQIVAHYTNDFVYERLPNGVLAELERRNPIDERGNRRSKHHQWLTDDVGHPLLAQHLHALLALMRVAPNWESLVEMLERAFPKRGNTLQIPFTSTLTNAPAPPSSQ